MAVSAYEEPDDFTPSGTPVAKPPTPGDATGLGASAAKGVWFMRPTPLFTNTQNLAGIAAASDWSQPNVNQWYDKADVKPQFTQLSPTDQMLYEAVADSMGNGKSGSGLFGDTVDMSAYQSTAGVKKTPQQILYEIAYERGVLRPDGTFDAAAAGGGSSGSGSKYGTTSASSRSVTLTDPDTAQSLVDSALESYLGRSASQDETDQFIAHLTAREKANPKMTSQSVTTAPGTSSTDTMTQGGTNSAQIAEEWAKGQEGAAEFQAASSYFDEFIKAIANPMDVVQ
jgi:hypothetical protein